LIKIDCEINFQ